MKIVFANRYFHPDQSATSRIISSLAFALARQGYQVTAIASRQYYNRPGPDLPARETVDGVNIVRLRTSDYGRSRIAGRALDYVTFHISAAAWLLANARSGDLCVVCTDPPLLSTTSALPVALRGARMVNWVMDLFPEAAVELGLLQRSGRAARLTVALRDWSHRRAALTICPTASMARHLSRAGLEDSRIAIVEQWADEREIHPVIREANGLRREWGLGNAFVVGYSGNFGRAHEFSTLLDAAARLRGRDDIVFLLIGEGQQRASVEAEAGARGLTNVMFKPFQPSEALADSLSASDVHIVSLLPSLEHCIIPSKFYGVLAAGRPTIFIGALDGEIATAVRDARCGQAVVPGDAQGLVSSILQLKNEPALHAAMCANARHLLEREHTLACGVTAWRNAIRAFLPADGLAAARPAASGVAS